MEFKEIYFRNLEVDDVRDIINKHNFELILLQEVEQASTEYYLGIVRLKDYETFILELSDNGSREIKYQQLKRGVVRMEYVPSEIMF